MLINIAGFSQLIISRVYYGPHPTELNTAVVLKQNNIKAEAVYLYHKEKNNKDSALVLVNFFDSLGFCIKKEEFKEKESTPYTITTYTYFEGLLMRQEIVSTTGYNSITTFDYDSAGNKIAQKSYYKGSKADLITEKKWEYDALGRVIKEYNNVDNHPFLYSAYYYNDWNNRLKEIKQYDSTGHWLYSYQYEYDYVSNKSSEYSVNKYTKNLEWESDYDNDNFLVKKLNSGNVLYQFKYTNGLLFSEKTRDQNLTTTYFKHYYFLYQW